MQVLAREVKCDKCGAIYQLDKDMPTIMMCICKNTNFLKNE